MAKPDTAAQYWAIAVPIKRIVSYKSGSHHEGGV